MNPNPRHVSIVEATRDLAEWLYDWQRRHNLTDAEYLQLLAEALHHRLNSHVASERRKP